MLTQTLIFTIIKFIVIVAVAVAGIFTGKALRDRKDKKDSQRKETKNE